MDPIPARHSLDYKRQVYSRDDSGTHKRRENYDRKYCESDFHDDDSRVDNGIVNVLHCDSITLSTLITLST